jgi:hypothetical protein
MSIDKDEVYADDIYDEPSPPINPNTLIFLYQLAFYTEGAKSVPRTEYDSQQRKFSGAMQDHLNDLLWGRAQFVKYNDLKLPPMIDMLRMFHKVETALVEVEMAVSQVEIYEFERTNAFGSFHSMVSVGESLGDKEYVKKKPVALWQKLKAEGSVIVPMHQAFDLAFALTLARQEVITREHRLNLEDNPHRDQWMSKNTDFMTSSPVIIEFFTQAVGVHKLAKKNLHDYLQSFRWHDIKWEENVLNWSQQKLAMYEVLSKKQKHFKRTFWLNEKDFILPSFPEGMKPAETILALDEDGELMGGATRRVDESEQLQILIRPLRQYNQLIPAPLENAPNGYLSINDKKAAILKIAVDQLDLSTEEDLTTYIEPSVFLSGVPNLSKTELHGILFALNNEKQISVEMEYDSEIIPMDEEAIPQKPINPMFTLLRYIIRPHHEMFPGMKLAAKSTPRWRKPEVLEDNEEFQEPKSNVIQYLNVVTDFGLRKVWNIDNRDLQISFHKVSSGKFLWEILLDKKGEVLKKDFLKTSIRNSLGRNKEAKTLDLTKTLDNLKGKLAKVADVKPKEIAGWFEETKDSLSLKNLD